MGASCSLVARGAHSRNFYDCIHMAEQGLDVHQSGITVLRIDYRRGFCNAVIGGGLTTACTDSGRVWSPCESLWCRQNIRSGSRDRVISTGFWEWEQTGISVRTCGTLKVLAFVEMRLSARVYVR